jgi:acyl dehydratase
MPYEKTSRLVLPRAFAYHCPAMNAKRPASTFRTRAHNTAADSENKIHDDRVASKYGFRGGLVPGVTVYGYMVPAILEQLGPEWMERGGVSVRFVAPCYQGATVVAACDGSMITAAAEDGSFYASGKVTMEYDAADQATTDYPVHPLPAKEQRPVASSETILPGWPLGSISQTLDVADESAIPERLLRMANEILVANFVMSPWIHVESVVRHHRLPDIGEGITVTGTILECFERKRRRFAAAGMTMSADDRPVATIRHTFIYEL